MTTDPIAQLELLKYPSTAHIAGSRLPQGDDASTQVPYARIAGRYIVVEEKIDGANSGLSFSSYGELLLQSRGHYLAGGGRERQFALFKRWASVHDERLLDVLEDRFVMYGEWSHKKHSVFYDRLPHYFNEFDIWDRSRARFLSTAARHALLQPVAVLSVPVLFRGVAPARLPDLMALVHGARQGPGWVPARRAADLQSLVPRSLAKSDQWRSTFEAAVVRERLDLAKCWKQSDKSDLAEGLYIKVEEDECVTERYKWVRHDFVQAILDAKMHHSRQPFVPNQLAPGVDLYAPQLAVTWADLGLVTVDGAR